MIQWVISFIFSVGFACELFWRYTDTVSRRCDCVTTSEQRIARRKLLQLKRSCIQPLASSSALYETAGYALHFLLSYFISWSLTAVVSYRLVKSWFKVECS